MSPNNDTNAKNSRGDKQLPAHCHLTEAEAALSGYFSLQCEEIISVFVGSFIMWLFKKKKRHYLISEFTVLKRALVLEIM